MRNIDSSVIEKSRYLLRPLKLNFLKIELNMFSSSSLGPKENEYPSAARNQINVTQTRRWLNMQTNAPKWNDVNSLHLRLEFAK